MSHDEDDITDEEIAALMAFTELDDIPRVPPRPLRDFRRASLGELDALARNREPNWVAAVCELASRAHDDAAARLVAELAKLPLLRAERLFHWASLTWMVIGELLAADTPVARACARAVFDTLDERDRVDVLFWLRTSIDEAQIDGLRT
ncbi:hypothetical protein ACWDSJ_31280 [Nocardia sp. NPDC003482]